MIADPLDFLDQPRIERPKSRKVSGKQQPNPPINYLDESAADDPLSFLDEKKDKLSRLEEKENKRINSNKKERSAPEKLTRLPAQYGLGYIDRRLMPYTLQADVLNDPDAQAAEYRKNIFEDIERLAEQKQTGVWDEQDEQLFQSLQGLIEDPKKAQEYVHTADVRPSTLLRKGIKAATGDDFTPEGPAEELAEFAGSFRPREYHKAYQTVKKIPEKIKNIFPKKPPSSGLPTPGSLPSASQNVPAGRKGFELAEEALGELKKPDLEKLEEVGSHLSPEKFYNEKHGGANISGLAKKEFNAVNKTVRKKYKSAEQAYAGKSDIFPELAEKAEKTLESLKQTSYPSTGEAAVIKQLEALQKMIGNKDGLRQTGVERLIKTADSMSQLLNYEIPGGGVKNVLKSFVRDINKSVIDALERQGVKTKILKDADRIYGDMADRFYNDEMKGFLERKVRNPESLYRKAISDEGTYRAIRDALGPKYAKSVNKLERGIAEKRIKPYVKNPENIGSSEYHEDMANLEGLLGKEKANKIKNALEKKAHFAPVKGAITKASKYLGKTPEDIEAMMNTRSGIKQLRDALNKKGASQIFDKIAEEKLLQISRGGNVAPAKLTQADLHEQIIKEKNYDIIDEIYGKEAADALVEATHHAYNKRLRWDMFKDLTKLVGKYAGAGKLVRVLSILIKS